MKKIVYFLLVALAVMACKKEEVNNVTSNPYDASITGTCVRGDAPKWVTDDNLTYSSMSLIIDQYGVPCAVSSKDKVAAFVGTSCRGTAQPFKDASNKWRMNLSVGAAADDEGQIQFEIRYYSASNQGTYTSRSITYSDGAILGSVTEGYVPSWK